jgi:phage terminase small subunit
MPPLRNLRQERFCLEYVKDQNGTRSYKAAGYTVRNENCAGSGSSALIRNHKIKARILEIEREIELEKRRQLVQVAEQNLIDQSWVVNTLVKNVNRSMQAEPVLDKFGRPIGTYTYEGSVANKGLELVGKHLGMFQEKSPLAGALDGAQVNISVYLPQKPARASVTSNGDVHARRNGDATPDD